MIRLKHLIMAVIVAVALSPTASAVDFNHDGVVDVKTAVTVAETTELDFGAVSDNDGTVTLGLADSITSDPNGIAAGGTVATGDYTITGESGALVTIVLTGSGPTSGLTIGNFTTDQADLNNVTITGGSIVLAIGADLTVAEATAAAGLNYPLNFTLGITYN